MEKAVDRGVLTPGKQISGWVGFGDAADYAKFTLTDTSNVSLELTGTDATRFTVFSAETGKAVIKANAKPGAPAATKPQQLDAGLYYLAVESTNAAKGGESRYTASVAQLEPIPMEVAIADVFADDSGLSGAADFGGDLLLNSGVEGAASQSLAGMTAFDLASDKTEKRPAAGALALK